MKYSKETSTLLQDAGLDVKNVGSSEAQIALLTDRIRSLTEHVKMHKKDVHSKHGLVKLVSQRKKLLKYLRKMSHLQKLNNGRTCLCGGNLAANASSYSIGAFSDGSVHTAPAAL